jgi:hypothetical protein
VSPCRICSPPPDFDALHVHDRQQGTFAEMELRPIPVSRSHFRPAWKREDPSPDPRGTRG